MNTPHLEKKEEFKKILTDYHISEAGADLLKGINLTLIVAPTSSGKNTIIDRLVTTNLYEMIVSDTTRPPRMEGDKLEEHGVRYFFRSEEDVLGDLKKGMFLEASLIHNQQVSGISLRELKKSADHNKIAINEVEVIGADKIIETKPDACAIFILPPSFDEWLRRMQHRGKMDDHEIRNRTESMKLELEFALSKEYYRFVVNDDLDAAIARIRNIVENDHHDQSAQIAGINTAKQLLDRTNTELA